MEINKFKLKRTISDDFKINDIVELVPGKSMMLDKSVSELLNLKENEVAIRKINKDSIRVNYNLTKCLSNELKPLKGGENSERDKKILFKN